MEFAKERANVVICARGETQLKAAAEELRLIGSTVLGISADVTIGADVDRVVRETLDAFDRIDVLVNNAGDGWLDHMLDSPDEAWNQCLDVNLMSAVRFCRVVVPQMKKQSTGRIINLSSVSGHTPPPMLIDYNAAKAAMLALSKTLSLQLADDNILVNSVCPAFLASDRASFITGSRFDVDERVPKSI